MTRGGTKPSFIEFKTSLELRGMRSFAGPLQDWLGGLGLPTRSPQFRTPTVNENARQEGKGDTAHQGATVVFSEEAQSKEPSADRRLDALLAFRIHLSEIKFNSSGSYGRGGKADVARATFRREGEIDEQLVAVKKHRYFIRIDKRKFANDFIREVEVMVGLSHENIVQLIGFIEDFESGKAWIVLSWVPNGNISEFLATGEWEIPERISLIKDTFEGVKYLHSREPPICHGDLKSFNILVSSSYRAIITDFGSARAIAAPEDQFMGDDGGEQVEATATTTEPACPSIQVGAACNQLTLTGPAWSLRWAAPEVVKGRRPGLSSDIWAAGWVCWEVMTNKVPFPELNSEGIITLTVIQGEVPLPGEDSQLAQIVAFCSLMTDCWAFDPRARPDIGRCCTELKWMPSTPPSGGTGSGPKMPSIALLLEMGETYLRQSSHEKAISLFQQALSLAEVMGDETDVASALKSIARGYYLQSKCGQAEEWFIRAHEAYARLGNDRGRAETLHWLGEVYRYQYKYTQAEEAHTRAQGIYDRLGQDRGRADTLMGLGRVYHCQCKYAQAEESFTRAEEIYCRLSDDQGQANTLCGLGDVYRLQSRYAHAEDSYTQAQKIYARLGDNQGRAITLDALGHVYCVRFEYNRAKESYAQAHEIYTGLGNDHGRANALEGLGHVYRLQSRYTQAEESYTQAQELYISLGNDQGQANTLEGLGRVYYLQFKYIPAEESFTAAQEIYVRLHHLLGQANTLRSMGYLRRERGQYVGAAAHLTEAMNLYDHLGMAKDAEDVMHDLALVLVE